MAYYNDDEEEQQGGPQLQQGGGQPGAPQAGGSFIQGQGATSAPSAAAGAAATAAKTPDNPGNFVGIKQYLDQNKPQAQKLARNVGGFVKGQGQEAQGALGQAQNTFNQQVGQNTIAADQGILDLATNNATSLIGNQEQLAQFEKMRDAEYGGPLALEQTDYFNPVMEAINKAKQSAKNTASVQGRNALLTDLQNANTQRSSAGAASLDNALLGASDQSRKILGRARNQVGKLDESLTEAQKAATDKAAQAQAETEATRQAARGSLTTGYNNLRSDLLSREAALDAEQLNQFRALQERAGNQTLTPEEMAKFGLSTGTLTHGVNLGDFLNYTDGADIYSVANQDDIARQAALRQLAGDFDLGDEILAQNNPLGQTRDPFAFNREGFEGAVKGKEQQYNQALQSMTVGQALGPTSNVAGDPGKLGTKNSRFFNMWKDKPISEAIKYYTNEAQGLRGTDGAPYNPNFSGKAKKLYEQQRTEAQNILNSILGPLQKNLQAKFNIGTTLGARPSDRVSLAI